MTQENILRKFQDTAERRGEEGCIRYKQGGIWRTLTWSETLSQVKLLSEALKKIGVLSSDRVAILSSTRYEWTLIDVAILSLQAVTVPIYSSTLSDEIQYILNNSESKVIFVENSTQLEKILKVRSQLTTLEKIILIEGKVLGDGILTFEEFKALGQGEASDFGARIRAISSEDLATIVYTSGTTGPPKGVMLTHGNLNAEITGIMQLLPLPRDLTSLIFLPLAHILARAVPQSWHLAHGFTQAYAESIDKLLENIQEIRPYFMISVPRIFEKIYTKVMHDIENASTARRRIFFWALGVGREYSKKLLQKQPIGAGLRWRYSLAHRLVFSKLHKKLGGRIRFFVCGGAPLTKEIAEFFHAFGILILEGYGLTETTAAVNVNLPDSVAFGTVGKPFPGIEEKIAPDGEILVRGLMVFRGYWKNPQATAEAINAEGWFHTGDIGEFDEQGRLKITDRKKDIIITAGGKNVAPQNIENLLKTHALFSQIVVYGDRRKFLTALITLNPEEVKTKAAELEISFENFSQLTQHSKIYDLVKKIIEEQNKELPKHESIKRFAILDKDFTIESGELTPTLKIKRRLISERYKDVFDKLYSE